MEILNDLTNKWNKDKKCDKCWKLVRTFNDHLKGVTNLYNPKDDCCTHIFLEGFRTKKGREREPFTGTIKKEYCDYYLHLRIAEVSDFSKSKADEYGCDDNIYDNHIKSLIDCLSCNFESDICDINPMAEIDDEETEPFFSFGDVNWAGIDYKLRIRIYND